MNRTLLFAILGTSTSRRQPLNHLPVPDFDADERRLVAQLLLERYGRIVTTEDVDAELALDASSRVLKLLQVPVDHERDTASEAQ